MPTPQIQNDGIYSLPFLYKTGLVLSYSNATTLICSAGQCRDSNNTIDMVVGGPELDGIGVPSLSLNTALKGAGGLDVGTLAASTMYAAYLIGDSRYYQPIAAILSLASNSAPTMPFGYDSYRLISYWATDGSENLLAGYYSGNNSAMTFTYDAPQATAVTTGAATGYTEVDLRKFVPPVNNIMAVIYTNYMPNAASDTLSLQPSNGTGTPVLIIGQVGGVHIASVSNVVAQLAADTGDISINYKVYSSSDTVAIDVGGFQISV